MAGAFQTSRDIFENPIWQNIVEFRLFFLIYGKATFKEGVKKGSINLNRGQWIRSYRNLQTDLIYIENRSEKMYSLSTIKRSVDNLVKQERIKILECELGTLFEVVNYAKYQDLNTYKNTIENAERTESEQQENGNETESEQQRNNKKNGINGIKGNKGNKKLYSELIQSYTSNVELQKALNDFIDFRKQIKVSLTERALALACKSLDKLTNDESEKIEIINQSIERGWKGLFAINKQQAYGQALKKEASFADILKEMEEDERKRTDSYNDDT